MELAFNGRIERFEVLECISQRLASEKIEAHGNGDGKVIQSIRLSKGCLPRIQV